MAHEYPSIWNAFCQRVHPGITGSCNQTEFYPQQFGNVKAENGSNNVSTYVTSSYGEGSIGYDEYAYALNAHWPVVAVENSAGYYVLPTASNVAVALTQAVINENSNSPDFLQQNLDSVYTYTDPRSYPLSSYSYLIVPKEGTKIPQVFSNGVGQSLSYFIDFYLCAGQKQAAPLGYSPLPLNLVQGGLHQVNLIPGHVTGPDPTTLAGCDNPTFTNGVLTVLKDAPYPNKCQKVGTPLTCNPNGSTTPAATSTGKPKPGASTDPRSTAGTTGGTGGTGGGTGTGGTTGTSAQNANITGSIVNVPGNGSDRILLAVITALGVAAAVAAPPSVAAYLRRRRGGAG